MILEKFYTIVSKEVLEEEISFLFHIQINNEHQIFEGHFPDNPIMPGVCMMQITKDLVQSISGNILFMKKCTNVKFMAIINPNVNKDLELQLNFKRNDDDEILVSNITKFDDTVALKLTALYKKL
tara:strand:+ start:78 stop:452 length:375 start_codon:yes stop_codon:yes gene_type:complete